MLPVLPGKEPGRAQAAGGATHAGRAAAASELQGQQRAMSSFVSAGRPREGAQAGQASHVQEPVGAGGSGSERPKTKARTEEKLCKVGPKMNGRQVAMQTDLLTIPSPLTHVGGDGTPSLDMNYTFH